MTLIEARGEAQATFATAPQDRADAATTLPSIVATPHRRTRFAGSRSGVATTS